MLSESEFLQRANRPHLFNSYNGMTVTSVGGGKAQGVLDVSENSMNPHGSVHGGCLYTLADTVAGSAVVFGSGRPCVTVSGTLEFLLPATGPKVQCSASPKKVGRTLWVMQVELSDQRERLVATGTFIFMLTGSSSDTAARTEAAPSTDS